MGARHSRRNGRAICLDRRYSGGIAARDRVHVPLVQASDPRRSEQGAIDVSPGRLLPAGLCAVFLCVSGYVAANLSGAASLWIFTPLVAGAFLCLFDWLPGRLKSMLMLILVLLLGIWIVGPVEGISRLFAVLLLSGGLVVASASFYRADPRPGYYPLMALLLLSIAALLRTRTSLEFFFSWEMITLSSYFLIAQARNAHPYALPFLLFSIASAFCLLAGFAMAAAANGTIDLAAFGAAGKDAWPAFVLLAVGFLIKAGAAGVHVWLPGAYAEADDDLSAMLSAVVSKVAIFGLFSVTYLAIRSEIGLDMAHVMGWVGLLTTLFGAAMALQQTDMKRMLAYSSMSQLGYIVTAIALMSHLGWVTAFYLVANHLMVKGILFLAAAGVILRTGTRLLEENGGLVRNMPFTFAAVATALISMSGLPPLAGFGGKWLLLSAMVEKGWYGLAALAVLATFVGFLYMFRLAYAVFLGERKAGFEAIARGAARTSCAAICPDHRHLRFDILPETVHGARIRSYRPCIRLNVGLGWHVAGNDLRILESHTCHGHYRRDRSGSLFRCLAALHLRISACPDDRRCGLLRILPTRSLALVEACRYSILARYIGFDAERRRLGSTDLYGRWPDLLPLCSMVRHCHLRDRHTYSLVVTPSPELIGWGAKIFL